MASVSFNGTTLADDASASYRLAGRVDDGAEVGTTRWDEVPVPRGNGVILKDMGDEPGMIVLAFPLSLSDSDVSGWRSTVEGLRGDIGTLVWPGGSEAGCALMSASITRSFAELVAGSIKHRCVAQMTFRRTTV